MDSKDEPIMDMHLINELISEIQEQMKMKFSENQLKKLHCLRLNVILQLKSEYFYTKDKTADKEMREIRVCYRSIGKTPSLSPEDYLPIVNIITCGRIRSIFKKHNHNFIIIEDGGSEVMCRLDNNPDLTEPVDTEDDPPEEHISENTRILLNAIENQKEELEKKITEIHIHNQTVDLLHHNVQVKGKLTFIDNNQQLVILVNSCFIIDKDELTAFHNLCGIREKYDQD